MKTKNKWCEKDIRDLFDNLDEITGADSKDVPININNRFKTTIARYRCFTKDREPLDFEFGKFIMNVENKKALDDVAIHEYAHWYLNSVLKVKNTGHTPQFKKIVKQLGSDNINATCTDFVAKELDEAKQKLNRI